MECSSVILIPIIIDSEPCNLLTAARESVGRKLMVWFCLLLPVAIIFFWIINLWFLRCVSSRSNAKRCQGFLPSRMAQAFQSANLFIFCSSLKRACTHQSTGSGALGHGGRNWQRTEGFPPETERRGEDGEWASLEEWEPWALCRTSTQATWNSEQTRRNGSGNWAPGSEALCPTRGLGPQSSKQKPRSTDHVRLSSASPISAQLDKY